MNLCYPVDYHERLFAALELQPGQETGKAIQQALKGVHHGYTAGPSRSGFDTADLLRAYTLYYMSINMPKLWFLLDRVPSLLSPSGAQHICEYGCGPGTFLWAFLFYLQQHNPERLPDLHLLGVDSCAEALMTARRLAESFTAHLSPEPDCRFETARWHERIDEPCDLAIFGNVLIEEDGGLCEAIAAGQPAASAVLLLEPGTRDAFGKLLPLRKAFLEAGWRLHFPCPAETDCPMAAGENNWCHFETPRHTLPFLQRMTKGVKNVSARNAFCGFLFTRPEHPLSAPLPEISTEIPNRGWRVLSRLKKIRGAALRWVCDGERVFEACLGRKDRSPGTQAFLDAGPGDHLNLRRVNLDKPDRLRQDDHVAISNPSSE